MNEFVIPTIFAVVFGVVFLSGGIYQIKTDKIALAKAAKGVAVDEPRQVGVMLVMLSLMGFFMTYVLASSAIAGEVISNDIVRLLGYFVGGVEIAFCAIAAIYGIKNKRIFGLKNTGKMKEVVAKCSIPFGVALICAGLGSASIYAFGAGTIGMIGGVVTVLSVATIIAITAIAEQAGKNK